MPFTVQLVSPEQVLYEGDANMVVAGTIGGGDIAFETGHAPFLGALQTWPIKLYMADGSQQRFAVHGGFVQVSGEKVIVLSDVAELGDGIDVERARAAKARAEAALKADANDADAAAALARANTRLEVASAA